MRVGGIFNGTGAGVYICLGFVPDWVHILNLENAELEQLRWNKSMQRTLEVVEGIYYVINDDNSQTVTEQTIGLGIIPYYGGEVLTSTMAGTTTYGEGVYLKRDDLDYRCYDGNKSPGDAVAVDIDTWTLDTAAANTGHFNEDVNGTYIGEGSQICIDGKWYTIVALTATQGEAADEVTLSHSVPSGTVHAITGKYGYKPMAANEVTKAGFYLANTTINVNDEMVSFEAGVYDVF